MAKHIGTKEGMHGKKPWFYSGFANKLVKAAEDQGFQFLRGYSNSRIYNPQLVLLGLEYGQHGFPYGCWRRNVENFLDEIVDEETIIVTSGDRVAMRDSNLHQNAKLITDRRELDPRNVVRKFVSDADSVWCYDLPGRLNDMSFLEDKGYSTFDDPYIEERDTVIAGGLAVDCHEAGNKKVVCVLPFQHFVFSDIIIGKVEEAKISYCLVAPKSLLDEKMQVRYQARAEAAARKTLKPPATESGGQKKSEPHQIP